MIEGDWSYLYPSTIFDCTYLIFFVLNHVFGFYDQAMITSAFLCVLFELTLYHLRQDVFWVKSVLSSEDMCLAQGHNM